MARLKRAFQIEVTQEDIDKALLEDSNNCMVTRAIARTIPEAMNISVDAAEIRFTLEPDRLQYAPVPYQVRGYIGAFDEGETIEPFSFWLRQPRVLRRTRRTEVSHNADRAWHRARRKALKEGATEEEARVAAAKARRRYVLNWRAKNRPVTVHEHQRALPGTKPAVSEDEAPKGKVVKTKRRKYGNREFKVYTEV